MLQLIKQLKPKYSTNSGLGDQKRKRKNYSFSSIFTSHIKGLWRNSCKLSRQLDNNVLVKNGDISAEFALVYLIKLINVT